jgi:hypothetical protein
MKPIAAFLQRIPAAAWAVVAAAVVIASLLFVYQRHGNAQYTAGRRSVTDGARIDSAALLAARLLVDSAVARVDTVVKRVMVTRWRTDTVQQQVPDSLRRVPEIAALLAITTTLTTQVDTLQYTLNRERESRRMERIATTQQLMAARAVIVLTQDSVAHLARRPTRKAQITTTIVGTLLGLLTGVLR